MAIVSPACDGGGSPTVPCASAQGGTTVIFPDSFAEPAGRGAIDSGQALV